MTQNNHDSERIKEDCYCEESSGKYHTRQCLLIKKLEKECAELRADLAAIIEQGKQDGCDPIHLCQEHHRYKCCTCAEIQDKLQADLASAREEVRNLNFLLDNLGLKDDVACQKITALTAENASLSEGLGKVKLILTRISQEDCKGVSVLVSQVKTMAGWAKEALAILNERVK